MNKVLMAPTLKTSSATINKRNHNNYTTAKLGENFNNGRQELNRSDSLHQCNINIESRKKPNTSLGGERSCKNIALILPRKKSSPVKTNHVSGSAAFHEYCKKANAGVVYLEK